MVNVVLDPRFARQPCGFLIDRVDLGPVLFRQPLRHTKHEVGAALIGVEDHFRRIAERPFLMRSTVILKRTTKAVLDATFGPETPAALDVLVDDVIGRPFSGLAAVAYKLPDGFAAFRRHPQKLDRNKASESLSFDVQPRVFSMVRALLRAEALAPLQERGADLNLISTITLT